MIIQQNVSLKPYNTFGMDEKARLFALVDSADDLDEIYKSRRFGSHRVLILGGGSNVLFTHRFIGLVAKIQIKGIQIIKEKKDDVWVSVGAGENWHQFVLWCLERGFAGVENLSLIPGTVGAAPIQNIGAYGAELKDVFYSLETYEIKTGKRVIFHKDECKFAYRTSVFKEIFKDQYVITRITLRLNKTPKFNVSYGDIESTLEQMQVKKLTLKKVSQAVINIRQSKLPDPIEIGNAGSFFKNPIIENPHFEALKALFPDVKSYPSDKENRKISAGWLLEKAGWKGYRKGDYGTHQHQALVLINTGNAKGKEIYKLSCQIQKSIHKKFGIELEREVRVI